MPNTDLFLDQNSSGPFQSLLRSVFSVNTEMAREKKGRTEQGLFSLEEIYSNYIINVTHNTHN